MWKSLSWVAARRGVTRQTIHRWITNGKYDRSKVQKTEGGHYRVWCPPEEYTSKTRSWDGYVELKLGSAKSISDGVISVDRDINGSRGIFLRALTR